MFLLKGMYDKESPSCWAINFHNKSRMYEALGFNPHDPTIPNTLIRKA